MVFQELEKSQRHPPTIVLLSTPCSTMTSDTTTVTPCTKPEPLPSEVTSDRLVTRLPTADLVSLTLPITNDAHGTGTLDSLLIKRNGSTVSPHRSMPSGRTVRLSAVTTKPTHTPA